jgi:hypothetical protein
MMPVMTTSTESFQIPIEAAEAYEDAFVSTAPAFLGHRIDGEEHASSW